MASCHLVQWSVGTKIHRFPFSVSGSDPTRSMVTFFQGPPVNSCCPLLILLVPPYFVVWQTSQSLTSAIIRDQYQVNLLSARPVLRCAKVWVCHTTVCQVAYGPGCTIEASNLQNSIELDRIMRACQRLLSQWSLLLPKPTCSLISSLFRWIVRCVIVTGFVSLGSVLWFLAKLNCTFICCSIIFAEPSVSPFFVQLYCIVIYCRLRLAVLAVTQ